MWPFKQKQDKKIASKGNIDLYHSKEEGKVRVEINAEVNSKHNLEMLEYMSSKNRINIFKGDIKHAYESRFLGYTDKCPRCNALTEQMMSNFAYATQGHSRLFTGPAGHFCTACPTVIINDDFISENIDTSRFHYYGVFTVDTGYSEVPCFFQTFNGEIPTYILDEGEDVAGIVQSVNQPNNTVVIDPEAVTNISSHTTGKSEKVRKTRKKNKAARKARKRNRKN